MERKDVNQFILDLDAGKHEDKLIYVREKYSELLQGMRQGKSFVNLVAQLAGNMNQVEFVCCCAKLCGRFDPYRFAKRLKNENKIPCQ